MPPSLFAALVAADAPTPLAPQGQLITAALLGIAVIVVLITWLKVHPFVALLLGALMTGLVAGAAPADAVSSFASGFGSTMGGVGILIGLGAMYGTLLADSGGADRIVDTLVARSSTRALPWMMGVVGALIGLPMFFEVGLVLLIPVVILVARRSGLPLMKVALPTLAGLSAMHGLVPPHPGPLVAIDALGANLGVTLAFGVLVAIPTVVVAGPLFGRLAARWVPVDIPPLFGGGAAEPREHRPGFAAAVASILLPVALMLGKAVADIVAPGSTSVGKGLLDFLGTPTVALTVALLAGFLLLGRGGRMGRSELQASLSSSLPPIAGILLIVGAGGGFKQVLVDTGIGQVVAQLAEGSGASALLLAWLVAVVIRIATGSATVATVTAAGILQPLTATMDGPMVALMVLAIGAGSVFLSHVNDAGFWLVKEYLGLSIGQTLTTWTVMECLVSVTGLAGVLIISAFVGGF
ncbi:MULTISPECIES: GntP family permease [unclassified Rathayibacter]|uniref:GntP family permease n=1 Tax=unclassified Rathayibacter TaxID=2609250 RepID=UPI00188A8667|nr:MULTISPECIES: gluconate:H+ symporter [unclassified Rathayibacter]MBF4462566.1 gluconate transporter [Rathayibacter sp. VKM Ac-2879]MBF4503391.1 gluconate transporter [Rathayibacter sp. VKM Ac-2878]